MAFRFHVVTNKLFAWWDLPRTVPRENAMEATAIFISIFVAIFIAIFIPLILSGPRWKAERDRAHARRIAEARMNARLLRLNL